MNKKIELTAEQLNECREIGEQFVFASIAATEAMRRGIEIGRAEAQQPEPSYLASILHQVLVDAEAQDVLSEWWSVIGHALAGNHSDALRDMMPEPSAELSDDEIFDIAMDGMANVMGCIYSTSVVEFARAVIAAHEAKRGQE